MTETWGGPTEPDFAIDTYLGVQEKPSRPAAA
jgi:hypothetical protein